MSDEYFYFKDKVWRETSQRMIERWADLAQRLQMRRLDVMPVGVLLVERYCAPHRKYHNLNHIEFCLDLKKQFVVHLHEPDLVEAAIWFHDAVYDVGADDNEQRSAYLADNMLSMAGLPDRECRLVAAMVLATKHDQRSPLHDAQMLCDIDLAILGQPNKVYKRYNHAIRAEAALSDEQFNPRRLAFLQEMLQRPRILNTDLFMQKYDQTARENMRRECQFLERRIKMEAGDAT